MNIFKTKIFNKWTLEAKISDQLLRKAVVEIEKRQYDASLGGYLYKKRIALGNRGKSSGARTIVAFKKENTAIFVYGFSKKQRANITSKELIALKKLAKAYFACTQEQIKKFLETEKFIEVK